MSDLAYNETTENVLVADLKVGDEVYMPYFDPTGFYPIQQIVHDRGVSLDGNAISEVYFSGKPTVFVTEVQAIGRKVVANAN